MPRFSAARLPLLLATVVGLGVLFSGAAPPGPRPAQAESGEDHEQASPLHEAMEDMDKPFRALRRQLRDASRNEESLEMLQGLQRLAATALREAPRRIEHVDEDDRPRFLLDYKRKMIEFYVAMLEAEEALLAGDNDKARAAYKKMGKLKREGHEAFQEEDEEENGGE